MIQDMSRQPDALLAHLERIQSTAEAVARVHRDAGPHWVLTGMATSLYAWQPGVFYIEQSGRGHAWLADTAELLDYGPPPSDDPRPLIVLSRSGSTAETVRLLESVKNGRTIIGITETEGSPLARRSDYTALFHAGEEAFPNTLSHTLSLAYTTACAQAIAGAPPEAAAAWITEAAEAVRAVLAHGGDGALDLARRLQTSSALLLVGRGYLDGIVHQGVLDLQEATRLAAIPVPGGLLRHGPIELAARPDVFTLILIPSNPAALLGTGAVSDLHAVGAKVGAIAAEGVPLETNAPVMRVPNVRPEAAPIAFAVALQLIVYHLARLQGLSEIKPALVGKVTLVE